MTTHSLPTPTPTDKQLNITKSILGCYDSIAQVVNGFVSLLTHIVTFAMSEIVIIAAPIPAVYSIFRAMVDGLHTPLWVGIAAASAIEIMSMFVSKTAIRSYQWNQQRTAKNEPESPFGLAVSMAALFYVVVLLLTLTIEIWTGATAVLMPGFVLAVIATYFCFAINGNLAKWEADKAALLADREARSGIKGEIKALESELSTLNTERAELVSTIAGLRDEVDTLKGTIARFKTQVAKTTRPSSNDSKTTFGPQNLPQANEAKQSQIAERQAQVLNLAADHSQTQIADILNVSVSTVKRDFKDLNGQILAIRGGAK